MLLSPKFIHYSFRGSLKMKNIFNDWWNHTTTKILNTCFADFGFQSDSPLNLSDWMLKVFCHHSNTKNDYIYDGCMIFEIYNENHTPKYYNENRCPSTIDM